MEVTRINDAQPYEARLHSNMSALRLQGLEASGLKSFSTSLSYFLPGGGAEWSCSPNEKVYVVLEGEVTLITEEDGNRVETTMGKLDSCFIEFNEYRAVENRTNAMVTILVMVSA